MNRFNEVILKKFGAVLAFGGLAFLVHSLGDGGVFARIWGVVYGLFVICAGICFWLKHGWAYLVVSVGLLASFLGGLIGLIVTIDGGELPGLVIQLRQCVPYLGLFTDKHTSVGGSAAALILTIVLIGYLGRWKVERQFRRHLDTDGHH